MDSIDVKLLELIQLDARTSIVELAERVNLTTTPCARRVQNLQKSGFIQGYVGLLDQARLGLTVSAFVELRLNRESPKDIEVFEQTIRQYAEIMECYALSGGHDYLLRVVATDLEAYHRFLRDKLLSIKSVDSVETSFALDRVIYRTNLPLEHLLKQGH